MGNFCNCKIENLKDDNDTINIEPNNFDKLKMYLFFIKMKKLEEKRTHLLISYSPYDDNNDNNKKLINNNRNLLNEKITYNLQQSLILRGNCLYTINVKNINKIFFYFILFHLILFYFNLF
jgi:hypothetical protein